jgi:hypothetical protein
LLVKNFCEDCPKIKLDTLELLRAVDCILRVPATIERVVVTVGGFLQAQDVRYNFNQKEGAHDRVGRLRWM